MNTWVKIAFIASIIIALLCYGHFNRYQIVVAGEGTAYKLDRLTGKVTFMYAGRERQITWTGE